MLLLCGAAGAAAGAAALSLCYWSRGRAKKNFFQKVDVDLSERLKANIPFAIKSFFCYRTDTCPWSYITDCWSLVDRYFNHSVLCGVSYFINNLWYQYLLEFGLSSNNHGKAKFGFIENPARSGR